MWAGSHKLATPGLLVVETGHLAKLSSAAWQLPAFHGQSTVLTLLPTLMASLLPGQNVARFLLCPWLRAPRSLPTCQNGSLEHENETRSD